MTVRPSARNSHGILRAQAAGLMLEGVESARRETRDWLISKEREEPVPQEESWIDLWTPPAVRRKKRIKMVVIM